MNDSKGERLAIKLLAGDAVRDREELAFMKHEWQVGRPLDHPDVIKIYDYSAERDCVYVSMELFQSPNLKQLINQGVEALAPLARSLRFSSAVSAT